MKRSFQVLWPYMCEVSRRPGARAWRAGSERSVRGRAAAGYRRCDRLPHRANLRLRKCSSFAALLAALSAIKGVFQYWMRVIIIGISRDIEFDLRNDLFHHLMTLSWDFYGKYRTGDIMARSTNDLNAVRMMLGPGVMYWTETMLTLVLAIGVMAWVDWPLALVALAAGAGRQLCRRGSSGA